MASIISTLSRLETKVDKISLGGSPDSPFRYLSSSQSFSPQSFPSSSSDTASGWQTEPAPGSRRGQQAKADLTMAHKVLVWPTICFELVQTENQAGLELESVSTGGTPWIIRQAMYRFGKEIPFDVGVPVFRSDVGRSELSYTSGTSFPDLSADVMEQLADSYFNTFNVLYPILDYDHFMKDILPQMLTGGFGYGDVPSVLALFVFALGQVGIDGAQGTPLANVQGIPSGIRGGTATHPPGLG